MKFCTCLISGVEYFMVVLIYVADETRFRFPSLDWVSVDSKAK